MSSSRKKHPDATRVDSDNPEWTAEEMARAVSVSRLPASLRKKLRGRPVVGGPKTAVSLRLPDDVLKRWKATGPGWQTRMVQRLSAP